MSELWAVAICLGLGTLAFRIGAAEVRGAGLPAGVRSALDWVPVAALAALVTPVLLAPKAGPGPDLALLAAALVTAAIAHRTRNLFASILLGLLVYWWL